MTCNIVLVRGTSGSGKTHLARRVMEQAGGEPRPMPLGERGKIGYYEWDNPPLCVMGRYDVACGGCDSQSWRGAADDQEAVIMRQLSLGRSVLLEGLMVSSWGVERLKRMDEAARGLGGKLTVIYMSTPLDVCLASVRARREAAGNTKPLNEENTRAKHHTLTVINRSNRAAGLTVEELDRETAAERAIALLLPGRRS